MLYIANRFVIEDKDSLYLRHKSQLVYTKRWVRVLKKFSSSSMSDDNKSEHAHDSHVILLFPAEYKNNLISDFSDSHIPDFTNELNFSSENNVAML